MAKVALAIIDNATTASKSGFERGSKIAAIATTIPSRIYLITRLHNSRELIESIIDNNNKVLFSLININIYKEKNFYLNKEN
jgi:hypothetical protein